MRHCSPIPAVILTQIQLPILDEAGLRALLGS